MKSSKNILEKLSDYIDTQNTYYSFNSNCTQSKKYKQARLEAIRYLNELVYYYFQKEKSLLDEFLINLKSQERIIQELPQSEYKDAILDTLKDIQERFNDVLTH